MRRRTASLLVLPASLAWFVPSGVLAEMSELERRFRGFPGPTQTSSPLHRSLATVPEHAQRAKEATFPANCALAEGFWKGPPLLWPAPYTPDRPFFASGRSWYEILLTPPRSENAYWVRGHQYIAARLNHARSVEVPMLVASALAETEERLAESTLYPAHPDPNALGWLRYSSGSTTGRSVLVHAPDWLGRQGGSARCALRDFSGRQTPAVREVGLRRALAFASSVG